MHKTCFINIFCLPFVQIQNLRKNITDESIDDGKSSISAHKKPHHGHNRSEKFELNSIGDEDENDLNRDKK